MWVYIAQPWMEIFQSKVESLQYWCMLEQIFRSEKVEFLDRVMCSVGWFGCPKCSFYEEILIFDQYHNNTLFIDLTIKDFAERKYI